MGDRIFFCYAREDQAFAVPLAQELKRRGVGVWLDQWDIPAEADWDQTIDKALRECDRLLIVLSPASVQSGEVRGELREALDLKKPILPVLYRPCEIPRQLRVIQFVDFSGPKADYEAALNRLVSACRGEAEEIKLVQTAPLPHAGKFRWKLPVGALAILLVIAIAGYALSNKAEERQRMNSVALSPNGAYLVAATGQGLGAGTARIWDVSSGRQLGRLSTKAGPFWVVAWSPKGDSLATGDHEGTIRTYDAGTWKLSHEFQGPRGPTKFIAWSPDGKALATGDDIGMLWGWDTTNGKRLFRSQVHSKNIDGAAWSPNGEQLATGSWDNSVAVVNAHDGSVVKRLPGHNSFVTTVTWSPDGKWIASGSLESPYLIVWDAYSYQSHTLDGHQNSVERVAWSHDGSYLASASKDNTVQFWDARTFNNARIFKLQGSFNSGESLAWAKAVNQAAAGDEANVLILVPQSDDVKKLAGYSTDPYSNIEIAGWSLDGKRLAAFRSNGGAMVWDMDTGNRVGSFRVSFFDAITD